MTISENLRFQLLKGKELQCVWSSKYVPMLPYLIGTFYFVEFGKHLAD